jgi:arylsulfatase A-like enzyme
MLHHHYSQLFACTLLFLLLATNYANAKKPNFVYILCDDMNEVLGDEAIVTQTRTLLADQGARANNAFVSSPKCTPSRSAWLSGRYYHNLRPNGATSGKGLNTSNFFDYDAIFPTLKRNGYKTALFGKIHNDQAEWLCARDNHTEPFSHIETECSPCGNYFPKTFVMKTGDSIYTTMETIAKDDPRSNYSHAQYGNRSAAFIKQAAAADEPFFVFVGTTGPHLPAIPAPWHQAIVRVPSPPPPAPGNSRALLIIRMFFGLPVKHIVDFQALCEREREERERAYLTLT